MTEHFYAVIMAGGGGTRLWPLSRNSNPKQLLNLVGERSLFQIAVDRLDGLFRPEDIFVVTIADQAEKLHLQCQQIPTRNFLIEPQPRGTASVVAMAAAAIQKIDPQGIMAVLTADHFIGNVPEFQSVLLSAYKVAQEGHLVTLGIPPAYPSTGYGYIERGKKLGIYAGHDAYQLAAFREKPDLETAQLFLQKGDFSWNSGMFIWKVDIILKQFEKLMPSLYKQLSELTAEIGIDHKSTHFKEIWGSIVPETIDYGIMEKSDDCVVLPASEMGWSDVGSWDSIFDVLPADKNGNIVINARHVGFETSGTLICAKNPDRLLVTIGMSNLIIIDSGDALLICPRGESQKVKNLVNFLKENQLTPFL